MIDSNLLYFIKNCDSKDYPLELYGKDLYKIFIAVEDLMVSVEDQIHYMEMCNDIGDLYDNLKASLERLKLELK